MAMPTYPAGFWHPFGCDPLCYGEFDVQQADLSWFRLQTWGWMVYDLPKFWYEGSYRGTNRRIPESDGTVGLPKRFDQYEFELIFYVTGLYDAAGDDHATAWAGLELNLATLNAAVFDPVEIDNGARTCRLTTPSGDTQNASIQFDRLSRRSSIDDAELVEFVLSGTILEGRFQ